MRYHNITHDDMLNGEGLRVVLWVAGCDHHCEGCQNPVTWNPDDGIIFDANAKDEIFKELEKEHVAGITFSGGDPMHPKNKEMICSLCKEIKDKFPNKTVWIYTGYSWEDVMQEEVMQFTDVLVDGKFIQELEDKTFHWAGSTNQKVIDVQKTLKEWKVILHDGH